MKIVLAIDEKNWKSLLDEVEHQSNWQHSVIAMVHVVEWTPTHKELVDSTDWTQFKKQQDEAVASLMNSVHSILSRKFPDALIEHYVLHGHPARRLAEFAHDWSADKIVVGSPVRAGLDRVFHESLSRELKILSPCELEVLTLPPSKPGKVSVSSQI